MPYYEKSIHDIPSILIAPPGGAKPDGGALLIHYHGWNGSKELRPELNELFESLALQGWYVVCPDCPQHGAREDAALRFRKSFNGWAVICEVMEAARQESRAYYDAICRELALRPRNLQVSGSSMGGLIAQMVALELEGCSKATSLIGRSTFHQADEWCRHAQAGTWCEVWCNEWAPFLHPERYRDMPLLFIDGGRDMDCPAELNAETVRRINEAGGEARQFVDPEAGHQLSPSMLEAMREWVVG